MDELKERLAESVRICVREELLESFGHVSARDPESKRIFVLRHLHERLDKVTAQDFIEVDEGGRTVGAGVVTKILEGARETDCAIACELHVYQIRNPAF